MKNLTINDDLFEEQCNQLRSRAMNKAYWGKLLLISLEQDVHKRLALYAADYGMAPTPFITEIVTEWVSKMDKRSLTK